ncbi:MAG: FeoB-associated Cys-rich membrane protein [Cyclobacteriaceae bacterium]|nr:FeoB-associated Cys-rich membrane protein [Cyclobacteriaceae bacterium]
MIQQLLVGLVFLGALGFLGVLVVRSFRAKEGCATGCGKCGVPANSTSVRPKP